MIHLDDSMIQTFQIVVAGIWIIMILLDAHKGFLTSLMDLVGTILAGLVSWFLSPILGEHFPLLASTPAMSLPDVLSTYANRICWFVIVFLVMILVIHSLEKISKQLHELPVFKQAGWILGGLVGVAHGFLLVCVVCVVLKTPLFANGNSFVENSWMTPILEIGDSIYTKYILPLDLQDFTDTQKEAIEAWLKENGY